MIEIAIPGGKTLRLEHLVMDYSGTLACDGELVMGATERLIALAPHLTLHVITADTFGKVAAAMHGLPCTVCILSQADHTQAKMAYVTELGQDNTACIGNGRNDKLMLQAAALGIAVVGPEGAALDAINAADVVAPNILAALDLLLRPLRLVAALRT